MINISTQKSSSLQIWYCICSQFDRNRKTIANAHTNVLQIFEYYRTPRINDYKIIKTVQETPINMNCF